MTELSVDVRVQVARWRNLLVDAARCGALASPLAALTHPHWEPLELQALWWLRSESLLPVGVLAMRLGGLAMPRLSRLVDRLEQGGLVRRERSVRHDRRRVRVRLTDTGRALAEETDAQVRERMAKLLSPLQGETRSALMDILELWVQALTVQARAAEEAGEEASEPSPPSDELLTASAA
ncbi:MULTISPECIES: MarR family transcriptional regulator [Corallococcus]|uniref:MarR family transcriptional regulator n=1 Tax=Corallococcus TaxID=83461 RepID=UPI001181725B|nr:MULTISPECIES: MarR family transcriptional regulator [Corallococcus]NBD10080.1 MarR family transcriptional regulator [Corallococcus silvisoli]TSC28434.1 MarR family transcriptional regulator [Corallococcus sp. Z5C101001]